MKSIDSRGARGVQLAERLRRRTRGNGDDKSSICSRTRTLTLGGSPARHKRGGPLRHRERQLPVRHTFSLSQRTLLFSRCSLGHERGPRARGRCSMTHAPSFLRITYLYLEPVRARRVTRDRTRSIDAYARFTTPASKNANENADWRRAPTTLDSLIYCTHSAASFCTRVILSYPERPRGFSPAAPAQWGDASISHYESRYDISDNFVDSFETIERQFFLQVTFRIFRSPLIVHTVCSLSGDSWIREKSLTFESSSGIGKKENRPKSWPWNASKLFWIWQFWKLIKNESPIFLYEYFKFFQIKISKINFKYFSIR